MKSTIFIIGFTAAGKTSFARKLAEQLGLPFIDTDEEIVKQESMSVNDIFSKKGEHYFRYCEHTLIKNLSVEHRVVSCGGGLPCYNDTILLLKDKGLVLYLYSSLELIYERLKGDLTRPVFRHKAKGELKETILKLYDNRKIYYHLSDLKIENTLSLDQAILKLKQTELNHS